MLHTNCLLIYVRGSILTVGYSVTGACFLVIYSTTRTMTNAGLNRSFVYVKCGGMIVIYIVLMENVCDYLGFICLLVTGIEHVDFMRANQGVIRDSINSLLNPVIAAWPRN